MNAAASWIEREAEDDKVVLYLTGIWRLSNVPAIADALRMLQLQTPHAFVVDGSRLKALDTAAGFTLLRHLADIGCDESDVTPRGFDPKHRRLLALVHDRMTTPPAAAQSAHLGMVQRIGAATIDLGRLLRTQDFIGAVALEVCALVRRPWLLRLRETASQFEAVCINAVPIVALVNFLIGVVIAYVLGVQAQRYGANLFVADGIGLAICRELSPILASVLVAGRSGAAFHSPYRDHESRRRD